MEQNLVSIFPQRSVDKIFQKVPLTTLTVTNTDTPVFGGYEQTVVVPHPYGKFPNVVMETSDDRSLWFPAPMGKKDYNLLFNFYTNIFSGRWVSTDTDVTFTFFAVTNSVPKQLNFRAVIYANL